MLWILVNFKTNYLPDCMTTVHSFISVTLYLFSKAAPTPPHTCRCIIIRHFKPTTSTKVLILHTPLKPAPHVKLSLSQSWWQHNPFQCSQDMKVIFPLYFSYFTHSQSLKKSFGVYFLKHSNLTPPRPRPSLTKTLLTGGLCIGNITTHSKRTTASLQCLLRWKKIIIK